MLCQALSAALKAVNAFTPRRQVGSSPGGGLADLKLEREPVQGYGHANPIGSPTNRNIGEDGTGDPCRNGEQEEPS